MSTSAITASLALTVTAVETLQLTSAPAANSVLQHKANNVSLSLTKTSALDVTEVVYARLALSSGSLTIDLTSVTDVYGKARDLTGLKLRRFAIKNENANALTVVKGSSNGHTSFGSSYSEVLPASDTVNSIPTWLDKSLAAGGVTISGSDKTFDLSGSGADEFDLILWAGSA